MRTDSDALDDEETCQKCLFWRVWKDGDLQGQCRASAPQLHMESKLAGEWPLTVYDNWCGQFFPDDEDEDDEEDDEA